MTAKSESCDGNSSEIKGRHCHCIATEAETKAAVLNWSLLLRMALEGLVSRNVSVKADPSDLWASWVDYALEYLVSFLETFERFDPSLIPQKKISPQLKISQKKHSPDISKKHGVHVISEYPDRYF